MEHLHARLENDTPSVCRHIVTLLTSSYWPPDKPATVQIDRCIRLIENAPMAARVFYKHLIKAISIREAGIKT